MTVKREHRELVEALATGEHAKARQLNEAISGEDRHGYNNYLGAVFAVLVDDHFKDNLSRDSIAKFVSRLRSEYQRAEHPINGLMIEGTIRAACGEEQLFNDIPGEQIYEAYVIVINKLATEGTVARADLDKFLNEAEELAAEWEREEQ